MRNYVVIYAPCQNLVTTGINIAVEDDPLTAVDTTQNGCFKRNLAWWSRGANGTWPGNNA